jgi:hypothetical protein
MLVLLNLKGTADFGTQKAIEEFSTKVMWFLFKTFEKQQKKKKKKGQKTLSKPDLGTSSH